ncbi:hypothetical protein M422DRAFT_65725 [Sphaerobolus stellatus SS14]|nr:hypothetical protein M422DRAFT_65725 [Sphaerobolus stellatus SS14]
MHRKKTTSTMTIPQQYEHLRLAVRKAKHKRGTNKYRQNTNNAAISNMYRDRHRLLNCLLLSAELLLIVSPSFTDHPAIAVFTYTTFPYADLVENVPLGPPGQEQEHIAVPKSKPKRHSKHGANKLSANTDDVVMSSSSPIDPATGLPAAFSRTILDFPVETTSHVSLDPRILNRGSGLPEEFDGNTMPDVHIPEGNSSNDETVEIPHDIEEDLPPPSAPMEDDLNGDLEEEEDSGSDMEEDDIVSPDVMETASGLLERMMLNFTERLLQSIDKRLDAFERMSHGHLNKTNIHLDDADIGNEADDESEDEDILRKKKKLNHGKKSRPREQTVLAEAVRECTMKLMKRKSQQEPLPRPPTAEELEHFANGEEDAIKPTKKDFAIHYLGEPQKEPWNMRCIDIFVKYFRKSSWKTVCNTKPKIRKAFITHMDTLRRKWKKTHKYALDEDAEERDLSLAARRTRRLNLYYRRLSTTKMHPGLRVHTALIRELGPRGMSSDESDYTGDKPRYIILTKPWRASAVGLLLRDIDRVTANMRKTFIGRIGQGPLQRLRIDSDSVSSTMAVTYLPGNCYDNDWFESLDDYGQECLHVQPHHDLTISTKVFPKSSVA